MNKLNIKRINCLEMGSSHSKNPQITHFNIDDWQEISEEQSENENSN